MFLPAPDGIVVLDVRGSHEVWTPDGETVVLRTVFVHFSGRGRADQAHAQELRFQNTRLLAGKDMTPTDEDVAALWSTIIRLFLSQPT